MAARHDPRFEHINIIETESDITVGDMAQWLLMVLSNGDIQGYAMEVQRRVEARRTEERMEAAQ